MPLTTVHPALRDKLGDDATTASFISLSVQIADMKASLLQWMFILLVAQTGVILGVLFFFLKVFLKP